MSFNNALNFPFSNNNLNKILQIGIVFGLIYGVEIILNNGQVGGLGTLLGAIGGLLFGLFVSGYGIIVMQNVLRNNETLPEFEVGDSIGRGFKIFLASLVYAIPIIIIVVVAIIFMAMSLGPTIDNLFEEIIRSLENPGYTPRYSQADSDAMAAFGMTMCGAIVLMIPIAFIFGFAAQIGMVRYAVEDRSGALYEFGTNIGMVFSKFGSVFKLFLHQLGIGIIYFIIAMIVGVISALFVGGSVNSNVGIFGIIILIIVNIISAILNTAQQMSNLHLMTGFAADAGLIQGKFKTDGTMDDAYNF